MPNLSKKTTENVYYQARIQASKYHDRLKSRETTAALLHIHPATLTKYETGILPVPHEVVVIMSELYNEPSLSNYYCTSECPIGKKYGTKLDKKEITVVVLQIMQNFRRVEKAKEKLLDITADGIISQEEVTDLQEILRYFGKIEKTIAELKLWANKNIKKGHLSAQTN